MARDVNPKKAFYLYVGERREIEENAGTLFTKMEHLVRIEKRLIYQTSDQISARYLRSQRP